MNYARRKQDEEVLQDLIQVVNPDDQDIVTLGAIILRYDVFDVLASVSLDIVGRWGFTEETLMKRCRSIWAGGFRPSLTDYGVGSSNDVQEES